MGTPGQTVVRTQNKKQIHRWRFLYSYEDGSSMRLDERLTFARPRGKGWELTAFYVGLSLRDPDGGCVAQIVRYDTAHGYPHRDNLYEKPTSKSPLPVEPLEDIRRFALDDLCSRWHGYLSKYLRNYV